MRVSVALLVLCLLSPAPLHAQVRTDRERDGLRGWVRAVEFRRAAVVTEDGKTTEGPPLLSHAVSYDPAGNRTELALYDRNGALSRRVTYTYDARSKRPSELTTYDARGVMTRKVVDAYGAHGLRSERTVYDWDDDGTLYRKSVLTFGPSGELVAVADYREDGSLIKKESAPFTRPSHPSAVRAASAENEDGIVGFGRGAGEYSEPDAEGNWTRGMMSPTFRTHASGKKIKTEEVVYRAFTYYR